MRPGLPMWPPLDGQPHRHRPPGMAASHPVAPALRTRPHWRPLVRTDQGKSPDEHYRAEALCIDNFRPLVIQSDMATLSRKQRDLIERGNLLLEIARDLLLKGGYHGLTMAQVALRAGSSKGTVYQHFSCKEEMIITLAAESVEKQRELVERAAMFRGRPRERMLAIGEATELFAQLHADDARIFQIMSGEAII